MTVVHPGDVVFGRKGWRTGNVTRRDGGHRDVGVCLGRFDECKRRDASCTGGTLSEVFSLGARESGVTGVFGVS